MYFNLLVYKYQNFSIRKLIIALKWNVNMWDSAILNILSALFNLLASNISYSEYQNLDQTEYWFPL